VTAEIIAFGIGCAIGYLVRSIDTTSRRFKADLAFIRSLPEPPSHVRLVDDDTDGLAL
jgi:hypothetical protein